jgi:hypothetical protein
MALGPTKPLTEMSTRNVREGKLRSAHKADKILPPSVNRLPENARPRHLKSDGLPRPVTETALLF